MYFLKNCSGDKGAGLRIPRDSFLCIIGVSCKPENCVGDSFDMNLSFGAVKKDLRKMRDLLFLISSTNIRKKMRSYYKYFINFSGFAIRLGSRCKNQIND